MSAKIPTNPHEKLLAQCEAEYARIREAAILAETPGDLWVVDREIEFEADLLFPIIADMRENRKKLEAHAARMNHDQILYELAGWRQITADRLQNILNDYDGAILVRHT